LKTSHLIIDFAPLRSESSIVSESQKQQRQKSKKVLIDTNLVIFGGGTQVSLTEPEQTDAVDQGTATPPPAARPNPTPDSIPRPRATRSPAVDAAERQ
jgi:hypothetical protein